MDKKLNNLIDFKDFSTFSMKVENKPGKKVVEGLNNIKSFESLVDEGFFTDTEIGNKIRRGAGFKNRDEKWAEAEELIMSHPVKRKVYEDLKRTDKDKATKYVEFFIKNPDGHPKWVGDNWVDVAKYSYSNAPDFDLS